MDDATPEDRIKYFGSGKDIDIRDKMYAYCEETGSLKKYVLDINGNLEMEGWSSLGIYSIMGISIDYCEQHCMGILLCVQGLKIL